VAEWLIVPDSKSGDGVTRSGVRIPPLPPTFRPNFFLSPIQLNVGQPGARFLWTAVAKRLATTPLCFRTPQGFDLPTSIICSTERLGVVGSSEPKRRGAPLFREQRGLPPQSKKRHEPAKVLRPVPPGDQGGRHFQALLACWRFFHECSGHDVERDDAQAIELLSGG
jgi:hypothetical protein